MTQPKLPLPESALPKTYPDWLVNAGAVGIFVILAILINIKPILDGILFEAHDVWLHLFWLEQFFREFSEGITYPRWLATGNYGLGSPAFIFYPPLVYFIGTIIRSLSHCTVQQEFLFLQTAAVACAGISAYVYGKEKFGIVASFAAAVFYMLAPYLMYDTYIRAALTETWTFAELPLLFWATEKVESGKKYACFVALILAAMLLTNIPISILTLLVWPAFILIHFFRQKLAKAERRKIFVQLGAGLFLGLALSAFYLLPAVMEKSFVNLNGWERPSINGITYGIGVFMQRRELLIVFCYTTVSGVILALAAWSAYRLLKLPNRLIETWGILYCLLLLLISPLSTFLWQHLSVLDLVHFSWLALTYLTFASYLFFGSSLSAVLKLPPAKRLFRNLCLVMLLQFVISCALGDGLLAKFRRGMHGTEPQMLTDESDLKANSARTTTLPYLIDRAVWYPEAPEYRPIILKTKKPIGEPQVAQPPQPLTISSQPCQVTKWSSYDRQLIIDASQPCSLKLRLFAFPGWQAYVDGERAASRQADDGLLELDIPQGFHKVEVRFEWTGWERLGIWLSLLSLLIVFCWQCDWFVYKSNQNVNWSKPRNP